MKYYIITFWCWTLLTSANVLAQHSPSRGKSCGTAQHMKYLQSMGVHDDKKFENWISDKLSTRVNKARRGVPYKIPVIVHILHRGETLGSGANLSYEQVRSQIDVLNADMQRKNIDASKTRTGGDANFLPVAGSLDITFELATLDPQGLPLSEPGVERINSVNRFKKRAWTQSETNTILKPQTIWNPDEYFNIWVVDIDTEGFLGVLFGFAQFPEVPFEIDLPGNINTLGYATDGVVMNYTVFGSNFNPITGEARANPFNLDPLAQRGRTLTHEVGHWLGLRHIWGDEEPNCGNDFVQDTPESSGPTPFEWPCFRAQNINSCGRGVEGDQRDMIENYMDYSNDECMNMFTVKQVERMITVLDNSPRRLSLLSSNKAKPIGDLLAAFKINASSAPIIGNNQFCIPNAITFNDLSQNFNNSPEISSWEWDFDATDIGGASIKSFSGKTPPPISFTTPGEYEIQLTVQNGSVTNSTTKKISVLEPFIPSTALVDNFQNLENTIWGTTYRILNEGWYPYLDTITNNVSIFAPNYVLDMQGRSIDFYSPPLNLSNFKTATLEFDVAYAYFSDPRGSAQKGIVEAFDGLEVIISTDCGQTFNSVWKKEGADLATTLSKFTSRPFAPTVSQWRRETINLTTTGALSVNDIIIIFRNTGRFGNNLFIDNIRINGAGIATLAAPNSLQVNSAKEKLSIGLNWKNNAPSASQVEIERSENNGEFTKIASVNPSTLSFEDTNVEETRLYSYRIVALKDNDKSAYSLPVTDTATLLPPSDLQVDYNYLQQGATLTWKDGSDYEKVYAIERSNEKENGYQEIGLVPADVTQFDDLRVETGKTYYYRVRGKADITPDALASIYITNENALITGNIEQEIFNDIQLYPNPASKEIKVFTEKFKGGIILRNTLGQTLYSVSKHSTNMVIPVEKLPRGLYFLEFNTSENKKVFRVLLQ